jgi:Na+-translocating ferredoxin:NAD+ oxidoreductase subunit B
MIESPAPVFDAVAVIDEARCIGCTLCIHVCPVDAIVGASKVMHTVIAAQCTGCRLCVPPCPVDCIEILELAPRDALARASAEATALARYERRGARLAREREERTVKLERERKKREVIARAVARARERLQKT